MKKFLLCAFVLAAAMCSCADASDIRLGIMSFANKDSSLSNDVAEPIGDMFFKTLFQAGKGKFRVVEHERLDSIQEAMTQEEAGTAVDAETAARIGAEARCSHVLTGSLNSLTTNSGGLSYGGLSIQIGKVKQKAKAVIDIKLVEVETGDIILMESAAAEVTKEEKGFDLLGIAGTSHNFEGLEGSALLKAVNNLTPKITAALAGNESAPAVQVSASANTPSPSAVTPSPKSTPAVSPARTDSSAASAGFENRSTDPAKVIKSYGLSEKDTNRLLVRHKDAAKMRSNAAKAEEYSKIFSKYGTDYLAAYNAALAEFNMNHKGAALSWCNKALKINPRYSPARALRKKAGGK